MSKRDLHHNCLQRIAYSVATLNSDTTTNGLIIDLQGFESVEFLNFVGSHTAGDVQMSIQHGNDAALGDATTATAEYILGDLANTNLDSDNQAGRIGYKVRDKRYVRVQMVADNGANLVAGALAVLYRPHVAATSELKDSV